MVSMALPMDVDPTAAELPPPGVDLAAGVVTADIRPDALGVAAIGAGVFVAVAGDIGVGPLELAGGADIRLAAGADIHSDAVGAVVVGVAVDGVAVDGVVVDGVVVIGPSDVLGVDVVLAGFATTNMTAGRPIPRQRLPLALLSCPRMLKAFPRNERLG